jgi:hypothetical protein
LSAAKTYLADHRSHRIEQPGRLAHPVTQSRAIQVDLFAGDDLGLPIQRQVVDVFADQPMRQLGRSRAAA